MTESYLNPTVEAEVSIAIERLLVADYPQSWTPARVSLAPTSLPTGFHDLGAVVEDTPSLRVTRNKFQLFTGIPSVLRYEATIGLEGTLAATLHSYSWRKLQLALGNFTYTCSAVTSDTVSSVGGRDEVTLSATTALTVGDLVLVAVSTTAMDDIDCPEAVISSIGTDGATLHFSPTLPSTPSAGDLVGTYSYVRMAIGTAKQREFAILGVSDFIDGAQVVHQVHRAVAADEVLQEIRPAQNQRIPLTFNLKGIASSDYTGYENKSHLILAETFFFPPGT